MAEAQAVHQVISEAEWERLWGGRRLMWTTSQYAALAMGVGSFAAAVIRAMVTANWSAFWGLVGPVIGVVLFGWFLARYVRWLRRVMPRLNQRLRARWPKLFRRDVDPNAPLPGDVLLETLSRKFPHLLPAVLAFFLVVPDMLQTFEQGGPARLESALGTTGVLAAGAITWFWIRGMHRRPPAAARLGALAGAVTMATVGTFGSLVLTMGELPARVILLNVFVNVVILGLVGLAGGLALQRIDHPRVGVRVAMGVGAVAIAGAFLAPPLRIIFPWLENLVGGICWGLALILYKPADSVFAGTAPGGPAPVVKSPPAARVIAGGAEAPTAVMPPIVPAVDPVRVDREARLGTVYMAGAGAYFGVIFAESILNAAQGGWWPWIRTLLVALAGGAATGALESIGRRLRRRAPESAGEMVGRPAGRWRSFLTGPAALIIWILLISLTAIAEGGTFGRVLSTLVYIPLAAGVTYAWILGADRPSPAAAKLGAISGAALGAIAVVLLAAGGAAGLTPVWTITSAVNWAAYGLAAGLLIDRGWGRGVALRVAAGIAGAALILALVRGLFFSPFWVSALLPQLFIAAGWGLGLRLFHPARGLLRG